MDLSHPLGQASRFPGAVFAYAYELCILICMRTTLHIDDELLSAARKCTGEKQKTKLVRLGLQALIEREAARRLARLGATMPKLEITPRRRAQRTRP